MILRLDIHLRLLSRPTYNCRHKCSTDFLGTLLIVVATKFENVATMLIVFCLVLCRDNFLKCRDNLQLSS